MSLDPESKTAYGASAAPFSAVKEVIYWPLKSAAIWFSSVSFVSDTCTVYLVTNSNNL